MIGQILNRNDTFAALEVISQCDLAAGSWLEAARTLYKSNAHNARRLHAALAQVVAESAALKRELAERDERPHRRALSEYSEAELCALTPEQLQNATFAKDWR